MPLYSSPSEADTDLSRAEIFTVAAKLTVLVRTLSVSK